MQTSIDIEIQNQQLYSDNEIVLNDEYIMYSKQKLGAGHFGSIFKGISIKTKLEYAIKIEQNDTRRPQLKKEYTLLKQLQGEGVPSVYYFKDYDQDRAMVMDLLGPNLNEIMLNTKRKAFSMKTVLMIGDLILNRLDCIHGKGIIHRDLKPQNMVIGIRQRENKIYLIDFGISKHYIDPKTDEHIQCKNKRPFLGTPNFASIHTHCGFEQSRRDDLESLGYVLIYFALGELPWQNIRGKTKEEKIEKISEMKSKLKETGELWRGLPEEFKLYFEYVFQLGFFEKPNYSYLSQLMKNALLKLGVYKDNSFDWCNIELNENPIFMLRAIKERQREEKEKMPKEEHKDKANMPLIENHNEKEKVIVSKGLEKCITKRKLPIVTKSSLKINNNINYIKEDLKNDEKIKSFIKKVAKVSSMPKYLIKGDI